MTTRLCPECAQGKPMNCAGWALDEATDELVACEGSGSDRSEPREVARGATNTHAPVSEDPAGKCGPQNSAERTT